jgi:hypothetical protein
MIYAYSNQQERATQIVKFHVSVFFPEQKEFMSTQAASCIHLKYIQAYILMQAAVSGH